MSLFLFDTDTLSHLEQKRISVVSRMLKASPASVGITVISVQEQFNGWLAVINKAKNDGERARLYQRLTDTVRVLSGLHVVTFSEPAILRYHALRSMKLGVGTMDLRIAAIALEEGATVVTRNLRDFQRVPGLACENWAD
jgi:tRNA(fMet)-specific endonuclease VapC